MLLREVYQLEQISVSFALMPRPSKARSAVSNGRRSFVDGDGKSVWARRHRDLVELHVADMGGGDRLSEAQISLVKRASTIEVQLEFEEGRLSKGEEIDLDAFTRVAGHLRRILETLGIERAKRDVTINPLVEHFKRPPVRRAAE